jgi:DNA-binding MarR family transcriptional regulator
MSLGIIVYGGIFLGKPLKIALFVIILVILLSIPNTSADDEKDVLKGNTGQEGPERPTVLPDLSLSSGDIEFSYERIEEEYILIINATITNYGFVGAYTYVEFYNDEINQDNLIGSDSLFIQSRDIGVSTIYWKTTFGRFNIHVIIADSIPRELIKRNNAADTTVTVSESDYPEKSSERVQDEDMDDPLSNVAVSLGHPVVSTGFAGSLLFLLFALANKHYMWLANLGAIPLYSRITNGQVLKQDTRKNIYDYIDSNPGSCFSSIMKDLKLKNGVTSYHLAMLEREGYIKCKYMGLYKRFYVNGASTRDFPQSKIRREIIQTIADNPGISQTDIASQLGVSNQVVNYHIGVLKKANFIKIIRDGFRTKCFVSSV